MDTITSIEKYIPKYSLNQRAINGILVELTGLAGIKSLNVETDSVWIEYYQQFLSSDLIKDALVRSGFPFEEKKPVENLLNRFITKMGEENNKEFGGKPPKCCGK